MTQTKSNYFLSQPHQPFFILGVANAVLMMLIFALNYKGILSLQMESANFHVYSLVFIVFTNVFTGFLFTTFPRFCQAKEVISKKYYINIFYYNLVGSLLFLIGSFISHIVLLTGMAVLFLAQIFIVLKLQEIYLNGKATDKKDAFWILTAQYFGLLGHILFIELELNHYIGLNVNLLSIAVNISFYMYLIFLAFSVAQRMIPFFSHSFAAKNENFVKIIFVLFILKSIFSAVDFLALFWLPTAFLLSALSLTTELLVGTSFYFLNIHLLAIGFLTTLLIGFGTRVTLGHSGQPPHADKLAANIFWFIQVVVIMRAAFSVNVAFGWGLNFLFDISFTLWLILFFIIIILNSINITFFINRKTLCYLRFSNFHIGLFFIFSLISNYVNSITIGIFY